MAENDVTAAEELDDTDVSLEDMDVSFDDSEDDSEDETPEASEDEPEEDLDPEDDEEEADEAPEETPEAEETPDPKSDEDKKAFNREMAARRLQEKAQREAKRKTEEAEYLNEAEDDRDLALRQLQLDAYENKVENNTNKLTNGYERAIKDFDVLRDATPEIQAEVSNAIDAFQAMYVTVDKYGNPTEVRGDLYAYLQSKADSIQKLTGIGARKQESAKTKEKSKTLVPPGRAPKQAKADPMLDGFDEEVAKWG